MRESCDLILELAILLDRLLCEPRDVLRGVVPRRRGLRRGECGHAVGFGERKS